MAMRDWRDCSTIYDWLCQILMTTSILCLTLCHRGVVEGRAGGGGWSTSLICHMLLLSRHTLVLSLFKLWFKQALVLKISENRFLVKLRKHVHAVTCREIYRQPQTNVLVCEDNHNNSCHLQAEGQRHGTQNNESHETAMIPCIQYWTTWLG